ncbi:hypothetical protein BGZ76_008121, partial [Entomortierella beljakovae]
NWGAEYEGIVRQTVRNTWLEQYADVEDLNDAETQSLPDPNNDDDELSLLGLYTNVARDELEDFVLMPLVREKPLGYWRKNSNSHPQLVKMARDFFAVPATSASSERCFSKARLLLPYSRNRLGSNRIKEQMLLHS